MSTLSPAPSKRVLLALSGGVDSSAAAILLKAQGYEVAGVVMRMSPAHDATVKAAQNAAKTLGIDLYILNLEREFKKEIIDYFADEYLNGRTPSPCVRCNPRIKFKYLLQTAYEEGFDYIATGHYAEIINDGGVCKLLASENDKRDQSYMLAGLGQDVLSRLICPLCGMEKDQVRELAKNSGLDCHDAPDSEENCFIPDNDYAKYIEDNYRKCESGDFISPEGKVCGRHSGIIHYTVGQRKGLGVALGKPCYVTEIDPSSNTVKLGYERAMTDRVVLAEVNEMFPESIKDGDRVHCKLRSTGKKMECTIKRDGESVILLLDPPTPRVPDGQAGVLYSGRTVLGGGRIVG